MTNIKVQDRDLRKAILAAFIGTVIEWYDYFLYGTAAALVFGKLFFPTISPAAGTMAAFATYAVGFLARPFGGMFFGYIGDKTVEKSHWFGRLSLWGVRLFSLAAFRHITPLVCSLPYC